MNKQPKVSLGLPVYNGEKFVAQAIDAVLNQTFEDFELIITDNCSTDRTQQICEMYAARDARIRYYRNEKNVGAAPNFIRAFELSSGKYFKWVAHDDLIAPQFIERCVEILEQDSSLVLCSTDVAVIDETGQQIDSYDLTLNTAAPNPGERFRSLILDWHMCFDIFGLIRSDALRQTQVMGNYGHGDGVVLAHLGLLGKFCKIPEPLFLSRRHAKQSMRMFGYSLEKGGNNYHEYAKWFDSKNKDKLIFPQWRIFWEYRKAIHHTGVGFRVSIQAYFYLLWWLAKNRAHLWNDLSIAARVILSQRNMRKHLEVSASE